MRTIVPTTRPVIFASMVLVCFQVEGQAGFTTTTGGYSAEDGVGVIPAGTGYLVGVRTFAAGTGHGAAMWNFGSTGGATLQTDLPLPGRVFLQALAPVSGGAIGVGSIIPPDSSGHDMLLFKVNGAGALQWAVHPGLPADQQLLGLTVLADGTIVACGVDNQAGRHEALVVRCSETGQVLWQATAGSSLDVEAHGVAVDGNDVMITGRELTFDGTSDCFFARFDLTGNLVWTTSWGGAANDQGRALIRVSPGKFVMAGTTRSYGPTNALGQRRNNVYLMRIDLLGDTSWTMTIGDTLYHRQGLSLAQAPNGDLYVAGERSLDNEGDALVVRTDADGALIWERIYQAGGDERLLAVQAMANGFVASGWSFGPESRQVLLVRRNDAGN